MGHVKIFVHPYNSWYMNQGEIDHAVDLGRDGSHSVMYSNTKQVLFFHLNVFLQDDKQSWLMEKCSSFRLRFILCRQTAYLTQFSPFQVDALLEYRHSLHRYLSGL